MCGRYYFDARPEELAAHFDLAVPPPAAKPRFNVAPSQLVAVIGLKADGTTRGMIRVKWGLVPNWANSHDDGFKPINARCETVDRLPTFRESIRSKRCLIPASGFIEWSRAGKAKVPHLFRPRSGGVMAFAGLWDRWDGPPSLLTCCIVTTPANETVRPLHDRMPAILNPADYGTWLNGEEPLHAALGLLRPAADDLLTVTRINPTVNNVRNDSPECIQPAEPEQLTLFR